MLSPFRQEKCILLAGETGTKKNFRDKFFSTGDSDDQHRFIRNFMGRDPDRGTRCSNARAAWKMRISLRASLFLSPMRRIVVFFCLRARRLGLLSGHPEALLVINRPGPVGIHTSVGFRYGPPVFSGAKTA